MKILIVEDNIELNTALCKGLQNKGFTIDTALDGKSGLNKSQINEYDLIILDLNLPYINGIKLAKKIRDSNSKIPLLALTARDKLTDKLVGFDSGFDDYLTKPFAFPELVARVQNLIRRSKPQKSMVLKIGKLKINPKTRKTYIGKKEIKLTKIEFNILEYLIRNKGIVIKNEELIEHIWNEESDLLDPPIRSHIKNLRKKINDKDFDIIKTIPGIGYKMG